IPNGSQFVSVTRVQEMEPDNGRNLERFEQELGRTGSYSLLPAYSQRRQLDQRLSIKKRELRIVPAWQIAEHDPAIVALRPDDQPVIPAGVTAAPVVGALEQVRRRRSPAPISQAN